MSRGLLLVVTLSVLRKKKMVLVAKALVGSHTLGSDGHSWSLSRWGNQIEVVERSSTEG